MTNEEKEHYLRVLVELQLFTIIRAIKESDIEDKDVAIEKQIKKFVNELPDYLFNIPNVEQKVRNILAKTEENSKKIRELQEGNDKKIDLGEER